MFFEDFSLLWSLVLVSTGIFSVYLSCYSYHRKNVQGAGELSFFLFAAALFAFSSVLEVNGFTFPRIRFFVKAGFFWASFTAPAFFLFSLRYFRQRQLPSFLYLLFFILSLLIGIQGFQFENHNLLYESYWLEENSMVPSFHYEGGPIYFAQIIYLVLLSLSAEILLLVKTVVSRGEVRKQSLFVFIGSFIPIINVAVFPERIAGGFDTQPLAIGFMGCFIAVSLFRYQMFNLLKAARENAVDNMGDSMIVLDNRGIVLDINKTGNELVLLEGFKIGRDYPVESDFGRYLNKLLSGFQGSSFTDLNYYKWNDEYYQVYIGRLQESTAKNKAGFVLIIRNMTNVVNLVNELEYQATYDSLTGIYNRRQWMLLARRKWELAREEGNSLTLIIFDIDHFKYVNDTYGHLFGDEVLREMADRVKGILRMSEILGRYGGEEFCIFCSVSEENTAFSIAERIRENIESSPFGRSRDPVPITASFGVYLARPSEKGDLDQFLRNADTALYQAKRRGRNCSVLYGP